jgi:hypothetical protein
MSSTDVLNTSGLQAFQFPEMSVYLGASDGSAPPDSSPTVFSDVYCSRVVQSASGSRLDYAELTWGLTGHLINRTQPANFARMVDVRIPTSPTELKIHRGDYVRESMRLDATEESLTAQSQMRPYHFGQPLTGYKVWSSHEQDLVVIQDDIVFNPTIDGQTEFNRSDASLTSADHDLQTGEPYAWTHPEMCDSDNGETYNEQARSEWTLPQAVYSVLHLLNEAKLFVDYPDAAAIAGVLTNAPKLRDVRISIGTHLTAALDTLLIPHGFNWYLNYTTATKPTIAFFKIGSGTTKTLKMQAPGAVLNLTQSNVNRLSIDSNIADSFNAVTVLGDYIRREVTLPLYPAWSADTDAMEPYQLAKDGPDFEDNQSTWRLWVANEAGDIDPLVQRLGKYPTVPDWLYVFDEFVPHRRTIEDPITVISLDAASGSGSNTNRDQRIPVLVEYTLDAAPPYEWKPVEDGWSVKICPDQIGVYFDGHDIPVELYEAGNNHQLRITGVVAGDARVTATAARSATNAVNGRAFEKVLAMPDKWQDVQRQVGGDYESRFVTMGYPAQERDDAAAALAYAEKIRDQNHFADLSCEFRLPGWHDEYKIGDLLSEVDGRELSLNAAPSTSTVNRYVQIVERRFEMGSSGPETVLIVDRGVTQ